MRVVDRVLDHAPWQRSLRPIRLLRTLRQFDVKKSLDQRGQTKFANPEQARRDHGVENCVRREIQAAPQQAKIEIGPLQNNLFFLQQLAQRRQIEIGQRIDQKIPFPRTDLEQTKFLAITMQTVRFRIYGDAIDRLEVMKQLV